MPEKKEDKEFKQRIRIKINGKLGQMMTSKDVNSGKDGSKSNLLNFPYSTGEMVSVCNNQGVEARAGQREHGGDLLYSSFYKFMIGQPLGDHQIGGVHEALEAVEPETGETHGASCGGAGMPRFRQVRDCPGQAGASQPPAPGNAPHLAARGGLSTTYRC